MIFPGPFWARRSKSIAKWGLDYWNPFINNAWLRNFDHEVWVSARWFLYHSRIKENR